MRIDQLPHLNAVLNGTSALLLLIGYVLVRRGKWRAHASFMLAACVSSLAFLAGYIILHMHVHETRVAEKFPWVSPGVRYFYFAILFPHLLLATIMVPMILLTLGRAYGRKWEKHRRIARPTFWIWLYVSATGVVIYWMLYHWFPGMAPGK